MFFEPIISQEGVKELDAQAAILDEKRQRRVMMSHFTVVPGRETGCVALTPDHLPWLHAASTRW